MVWAGVWIGGRSPLAVERDSEAPHKGYTALSKNIGGGLLPFYKPGMIFSRIMLRSMWLHPLKVGSWSMEFG